MAQVTFVLHGDEIQLADDQVVRAVQGMEPDYIWTWSVTVGGVTFPVKQVFRAAIGRDDFNSTRAAKLLMRLGFTVMRDGVPVKATAALDEDDEGSDPLADDTRMAALNAAISYASTRPHVEVGGVLAAAEAFDAWLRLSGVTK